MGLWTRVNDFELQVQFLQFFDSLFFNEARNIFQIFWGMYHHKIQRTSKNVIFSIDFL